MARWNVSDIPPQQGRTAVVTGTAGLGFEIASALATAGGTVIVAGRNPQKGATAVEQIRRNARSDTVTFELLDLADLASIRDFSARMIAQHSTLSLLVNNAGVMMPPRQPGTRDGFELQFGVNHLGHFALTGLLLPLLQASAKEAFAARTTAPRVVNVSSLAHRGGKIDFDDLQSERRYQSIAAYRQSKLAVLMFALELQRRSEAAGWGIVSNAAHPGLSRTELFDKGTGAALFTVVNRFLGPVLMQPAAQGALPILFAATSPHAIGGGYYGPDGLMEAKGWPTTAKIAPQAQDIQVARRLWKISEQLTGVTFAAAR